MTKSKYCKKSKIKLVQNFKID